MKEKKENGMGLRASERMVRGERRVNVMLVGVVIFAGGLVLVRHALADRATPFVETTRKVGDVSESYGYVVAQRPKVEECKHYLVIVGTDTMQHVVIRATAKKGMVKESLLGRPVMIKAEVTERKKDPKTERVTVQLKILSVKPWKKASEVKKQK